MSVNPELRKLEIDIPSQPQALVQLSLLLAEEDINLAAAASLIETDMALAAAVMKAVNSSLYGLKGRVQSVQQAITYLGMREVAAITFEMGLRAAFPPAVELEPLWSRAGRRGLLMGRLGQRLGLDGWAAHSAGLFEECGKAVLFRHAPDHYRAMLRAAGHYPAGDVELVTLEHAGFGVSHDALGAALCESWGLGPAAVTAVRYHVHAQATRQLPELPAQAQPAQAAGRRAILALSVLVHVLMNDAQALDEVAAAIAPQADLDPVLVRRAARQVQEQLDEAARNGRD
ncbi:MAG: HDOD domain-containing protein [Rubrivivax sp.]|nr:HDOD domain-containing protein [Rubrivivax sp.]